MIGVYGFFPTPISSIPTTNLSRLKNDAWKTVFLVGHSMVSGAKFVFWGCLLPMSVWLKKPSSYSGRGFQPRRLGNHEQFIKSFHLWGGSFHLWGGSFHLWGGDFTFGVEIPRTSSNKACWKFSRKARNIFFKNTW